MKIVKQNNINFQKKLMAHCKVGTNDNSQNASIYQLEYPIDTDYFKNCARDNKNWIKSYYLEEVSLNFEYYGDRNLFYVMENEDGDTLCISVLNDKKDEQNRLEYLETAPKLSSYNTDSRKVKYIGETMLAFLVKITNGVKSRFYIPEVAQRDKKKDFYYKLCGFHSGGYEDAYLDNYEFDNFIEQNEAHTKSQIEIL